MKCAICQIRRPRRFCPGVRGDICTVCCGEQREVTVSCPLDCEFLLEARKHERVERIGPQALPNRDIVIKDGFLDEHESLFVYLAHILYSAAVETSGTVDSDVQEALEGLIRTYRTLQSGVVYESIPTNPLAANVFRAVQRGLDDFRREETQGLGFSKTRDADVLKTLVYVQWTGLHSNNGRPRCRAFIGSMKELDAAVTENAPTPPSSSLILP
ncbi:MAG TPA: hypothetical protein VMH81_24990 [Bryobacteraceae bacterium]|nr:hypothetical protein [Bryobacteraceae bacterium]